MSRPPRLVSRNTIFRRLWLAQTGSSLGDWFNIVALTTVTLNLTHSPTAVGIVLLCLELPQAILSLFAGPFLDRYSKRTLMYASDLGRALVCGLFIWGALQQQIWVFYLGALCMGIGSSLFVPARGATIPLVVSEEDLTEASAWSVATSGILAILGAALGGVVTALLSPALAFLINAVSFLWSASMILATTWEEKRERTESTNLKPSYFRELKEGLHVVVRDRMILALFLTIVAFALMAGPYFVLIPVLGDLSYHLGGLGIGLLYVADGLAFILSAMVVDRLASGKAATVSLWYGGGFLIEAIFFALFAFSSSVVVGMLCLFVSQLGSGILITLADPLLQKATQPETRGRVFALNTSLYTGTKQLSLLVSGPVLSLVGAPLLGLITGGIGCIAGAGWWLANSRSHRLSSNKGTPEYQAQAED